MKTTIFTFTLILFVLSACDSSKTVETPVSHFIGKWKLVNRGMFDRIIVEITEDDEGNFSGNVVKLNDNKYVRLFMEVGYKLISNIKRNSNFEFVITEKKIAAPLFSAYGQSTSTDIIAVFDGKNKIVFNKNGIDGNYVRINNKKNK